MAVPMYDALAYAFTEIAHDKAEEFAEDSLEERQDQVGKLQAAIESICSDHFYMLSRTTQMHCLQAVLRQMLIERSVASFSRPAASEDPAHPPPASELPVSDDGKPHR